MKINSMFAKLCVVLACCLCGPAHSMNLKEKIKNFFTPQEQKNKQYEQARAASIIAFESRVAFKEFKKLTRDLALYQFPDATLNTPYPSYSRSITNTLLGYVLEACADPLRHETTGLLYDVEYKNLLHNLFKQKELRTDCYIEKRGNRYSLYVWWLFLGDAYALNKLDVTHEVFTIMHEHGMRLPNKLGSWSEVEPAYTSCWVYLRDLYHMAENEKAKKDVKQLADNLMRCGVKDELVRVWPDGERRYLSDYANDELLQYVYGLLLLQHLGRNVLNLSTKMHDVTYVFT